MTREEFWAEMRRKWVEGAEYHGVHPELAEAWFKSAHACGHAAGVAETLALVKQYGSDTAAVIDMLAQAELATRGIS